MPDGNQEKKVDSINLEKLLDKVRHNFHLIDESLNRFSEENVKELSLNEEIKVLREDFSVVEKRFGNDKEALPAIQRLRTSITALEKKASQAATIDTTQPEVIKKLVEEIQKEAARIPELAEFLAIDSGVELGIPQPLSQLVLPKELPFYKIQSNRILTEVDRGFEVIESAGDGMTIRSNEIPEKIRIQILTEEGEKISGNVPVVIKGIDASGKEEVIRNLETNKEGYVSFKIGDTRELMNFKSLEAGVPSTGATSRMVINEIYKQSGKLRLTIDKRYKDILRERFNRTRTAGPSIFIEDPDAEDLSNNPEVFSFDIHQTDGTSCIKARSEIAVRNFNFSQLVRIDESDLIGTTKSANESYKRVPVTAPIPVREVNNKGVNFSVLGANIITGKIINYRQYWQPVAQGLGELLYSLPLAPREEVKIAIVDWQRTERSTREEMTRAGESLTGQITHDSLVNDIVTGEISESVTGGSSGGSTTRSNNKPKWYEYLAGGALGFLVGGPVGAAVGVGAVHMIRPDTGADSNANIEAWNNAVRNISAKAVSKASDTVSQRASMARDFRSTIVTTSQITEHENVETRTVRNRNQNHALTIQYYQVLSHYKVVTEAISEQDVLLVPYGIDENIFSDLGSYGSFMKNPLSKKITQFILNHQDAVSEVIPNTLMSGLSALNRLAFDADLYEELEVTASSWHVNTKKGLPKGATLYLETNRGLIEMKSMNGAQSSYFQTPRIAVDSVKGIRLEIDFSKYLSGSLGSLFSSIMGNQSLIETILSSIKLSVTIVSVDAFIDRANYIKSNQSALLFPLSGSDSMDLDAKNSSSTVYLQPFDASSFIKPQSDLKILDFHKVKELVDWIHRYPMAVHAAIWMSEDSNERALRFDRYMYNGKPLLNVIDNTPLGIDGNYVAFRFAPGLRVSPPIDMSKVKTVSNVISVPTKGVFAEAYLSCNIATEQRDVTRDIDESKAVPFSATDIAPIQTGTRETGQVPNQSLMPSPIVNFQNVPPTSDSGMQGLLSSLTAESPFPNLSFGAETMETIQTLAKTAMEVDGEKQKEILKTISDLTKAAMGVASDKEGGSASSGRSSGGGSTGGSVSGPSGKASGSTPKSNNDSEMNRGKEIRESDPQKNQDHATVIRDAVKKGNLSEEEGSNIIKSLYGIDNNQQTDSLNQSVDLSYDVELIPQLTGMSCWAAASAMLVGWRDRISINPDEIVKGIGYWEQYKEGLPLEDVSIFDYWGLVYYQAMSYSIEGFYSLLKEKGPLWVGTIEGGAHVRVVTGIFGDGTANGTFLRINDPWQKGMNSFELPNTGSKYLERYADFKEKQRKLLEINDNATLLAHVP